jgi:phosphatidylglycerophosphatase A
MSVKAKASKGKSRMPSDNVAQHSQSPKPPGRRPWQLLVVTLCGAGLLRPAPGTWGSLAATLFLWGEYRLNDKYWLGVKAPWSSVLVSNVWLGKWIVEYFGKDDPGACVIDEGAGICLTLLGLPMARPWITFALAFAAFRLFDVLKPPPARQLERLPLGWGILLDDLAAAVYANLLCQIILRYA